MQDLPFDDKTLQRVNYLKWNDVTTNDVTTA